jgi:hypothetical protein
VVKGGERTIIINPCAQHHCHDDVPMYVNMSTHNSRELHTSTPFVFTHLYPASSINTVSKRKKQKQSSTNCKLQGVVERWSFYTLRVGGGCGNFCIAVERFHDRGHAVHRAHERFLYTSMHYGAFTPQTDCI